MSKFIAYPIKSKKRILIASMHWGLGHATRCIPIINALIDCGFEPVIASDGAALELLEKEFPKLDAIELPSYNISYAKKGNQFKLKLIKDTPQILNTIKKEKRFIKAYLENNTIHGIISDNRFGVRHKSVPSVFMTHQLRVLSGNTTWLSSKMHHSIIEKFDECWVPDHKGVQNLSGDLGHLNTLNPKIKYIGPLSRLKKQSLKKIYNIMVLLSGPEPQRTYLEKKLIIELSTLKKPILFVSGIVEDPQSVRQENNITYYNYMTTDQLQTAINSSEYVISRSGYTTIMDLTKLEKKAFFIPTPGQFEQEYLAKRFSEQYIIPSCSQGEFTIDLLKQLKSYKGFTGINYEVNFKKLFSLF